jgi:hypothetical protein
MAGEILNPRALAKGMKKSILRFFGELGTGNGKRYSLAPIR